MSSITLNPPRRDQRVRIAADAVISAYINELSSPALAVLRPAPRDEGESERARDDVERAQLVPMTIGER